MQNMNNMYDVDMTALVHSFQDACADKEFRNYLNSLNIKDDILMKYTSSLEDAFEECKNCQTCKNLDACKNKVPGFASSIALVMYKALVVFLLNVIEP